MFTVKEETTVVGISELRTHLNDILSIAKEKNVVLTKRNKPVLAVIDYEHYHQLNELIENLEDTFLEEIAQQRLSRKERKTIPLSEAMKMVGL